MNYTVHLILTFLTGFLWIPIYQLLCFIELNKLAMYPVPEDVPPTRTSIIAILLLALSLFGLPYLVYRKYHLLRGYLTAMNGHLDPLPKIKHEDGEETEQIRLNCLEAKKMIGFALTDFFLLALVASTFGLYLYYHTLFNTTGATGSALMDAGAYMILLVVAITSLFILIGFTGRVIVEERKWHKAFNAIAMELGKE